MVLLRGNRGDDDLNRGGGGGLMATVRERVGRELKVKMRFKE